jgi:hypothetical protein
MKTNVVPLSSVRFRSVFIPIVQDLLHNAQIELYIAYALIFFDLKIYTQLELYIVYVLIFFYSLRSLILVANIDVSRR